MWIKSKDGVYIDTASASVLRTRTIPDSNSIPNYQVIFVTPSIAAIVVQEGYGKLQDAQEALDTAMADVEDVVELESPMADPEVEDAEVEEKEN